MFSFFNVKRKKQNISTNKTTSSFVSKIHQNDNLTKILANRQNEDTYIFFNSGKTFCWSDLANNPKVSIISLLNQKKKKKKKNKLKKTKIIIKKNKNNINYLK